MWNYSHSLLMEVQKRSYKFLTKLKIGLYNPAMQSQVFLTKGVEFYVHIKTYTLTFIAIFNYYELETSSLLIGKFLKFT